MDDAAFDRALIAAAFQIAADQGWCAVSVAASARTADLPLAKARERFPVRAAILIHFGRLADVAALTETSSDGSVRDRLFDLLMRRIDTLQVHRAGVLALLRALPGDPPTALLLSLTTRRSMRWMLDATGIPSRGLTGELRVKGLVAVWLWTIRAWQSDETEDLSATMAALDTALRRAGQAAGWLGGRASAPEIPPSADSSAEPEPPAPDAPT